MGMIGHVHQFKQSHCPLGALIDWIMIPVIHGEQDVLDRCQGGEWPAPQKLIQLMS